MRWREDGNLILEALSIEDELASEDVPFCWVQLLDNLIIREARN